ncbi:MAG UNVERIFIED_CONTAM: HAD-IC family P-type ATPase [Planctomycetaceae bacterium]
MALRERALNVDVLMIVAAAGAAGIGEWLEAIVLLFLFSLSGTLEAFAMYRTTRSIESLIQLRPLEATRVDGATEQIVPVTSLSPGHVLRVRPGERFPVDGVIEEGETWADESMLTGESEPVVRGLGAMVFAGTINGSGSVLVRMTRGVADTTLERIVHMVQEAQSRRTPSQRFVESWQQPYVIGVLTATLLVLFGARLLHRDTWPDSLYHAMVLLVAASPCAVVVGSPAVLLSAIARAGRQGVLFKGGLHLENLGKVEVLAFDKTGTVTLGRPAVMEVWAPPAQDVNRLLSLACAVEHRSEHPLKAPVLAEGERRGLRPVETPLVEFHSHTGLGVHAQVEGVWVGVGREGLFDSHELRLPAELLENAERIRQAGCTALLIHTSEPGLFGVIGVADQIRPEASHALQALKRLGLRHLGNSHRRPRTRRGVWSRRKLGADDVLRGTAAGPEGCPVVATGQGWFHGRDGWRRRQRRPARSRLLRSASPWAARAPTRLWKWLMWYSCGTTSVHCRWRSGSAAQHVVECVRI